MDSVAISMNYIDGSNARRVADQIAALKIAKETEWQELLKVIAQDGAGDTGMDLTMPTAGVSAASVRG
jgi:hypothetical protein